MHHANHWYGHAKIMARYAGLADVPRIWGYLQHGWNIHDGYAPGTAFAPNFPLFVWTESVARRGWATGLRDYVVVGSPWAYLLKLENQTAWEAKNPKREGTIVYPFHGWEQQSIIGSHDRYIEEIREMEGDVPITVCLYWNEYRDPAVRAAYEKTGVRVISHGYRGFMYKGTDLRFLDKQLAEMRRHKRVVSNRMGSALFYGASTGAEVGVYGDPMILEAERAALGGMDRQLRNWPEMHQPFVPYERARELARKELGMDEMVSPTELRQLFGWEHARRASGPAQPVRTEGELGAAEASAPAQPDKLPTDDAPNRPVDDGLVSSDEVPGQGGAAGNVDGKAASGNDLEQVGGQTSGGTD